MWDALHAVQVGIAPLSRNRIVLICKIGTAASLLVLGVVFLWAQSFFFQLDFYLFKLAVCFLLFLFAFHWFFGSKRNLTATQTRLIDYAYLVIAALGIFVFALNQDERRYTFRQIEIQDEGRRILEKSIIIMENSLTDLEGAACSPAAVQVMPQHCERVKQLKVEFGTKRPSEANRDFIRIVEDYLSTVPSPPASDEFSRQIYRRIEAATDNLKYKTKRVEIDILLIKSQEPLPPPEIGEPGSRIYGLFTWPFILVFAFALRITKTTIEVLDWAKKSAA